MRLSLAYVTLATLCCSRTFAQQSTQNLVSPASTSGSLTGLKYTNVGATGTYNQVTNLVPGTFPSCDVNPSCITQPKQISGTRHAPLLFSTSLSVVPVLAVSDADTLCFLDILIFGAGVGVSPHLTSRRFIAINAAVIMMLLLVDNDGSVPSVGALAPFNEEMTFNFRGPLNLYNIAVYQPASMNDTTWTQTSSWAAGQAPNNLVFMNNLGGDKSGVFSICGGNSQSFANGAWTDATTAANAEVASGFLDENHEINIMTAQTCDDSPCDGFARGTANHGWADSKMLVVTFDMPPSSDASKVPAIWALNAQVVRSAEYGCNCRGEGSPGGCGEFDILETLVGADPNQGISEIYSVKGATGSGSTNFFARPTTDKVTYGVVLDVQTDSIAIQRLTSWDYTQTSVSREVIDGYLNAPALEVSFATGARKRGVVGGHRRRH
ncbi:hypothetical protein GY45DRAFT_753316 [Cubamyces sp. BRFM 1775]|nr:hypothetical protein GY45DRAFT_753316 [Cubamyces sp. BRFM 1775]